MRAPRLRIRAPMPPPRERTLTPPIERPTTLPAASRIVEDIGDPASSLRAAQDGNTRRLAELQDVGYLLERVRDRNGCSLTHRAAGSGRLETLAWLLTRTGCRADHASDHLLDEGTRLLVLLAHTFQQLGLSTIDKEDLLERLALIAIDLPGGIDQRLQRSHDRYKRSVGHLIEERAVSD